MNRRTELNSTIAIIRMIGTTSPIRNSTATTGATTVPTPMELRGVFCSKNSKLYAIVMAQNAVEKGSTTFDGFELMS